MKKFWQRAIDEDWLLAFGVLLALGAPNVVIILGVLLK